MPELPEVETICRGLAPAIVQQKIVAVVVHNTKLRYPIPNNLAKILAKQTIQKIYRRGKYILLTTKKGTLIIHLGMSGTLQIKSKNHPIGKHEHFILTFANDLSLCYKDPRRFGAILWTNKDPLKHPLLKKLGLEPLDNNFTANYLYDRAKSKHCAIKQFIMNNEVVTGIGNIYANEVLFAAKINPLKAANTITLRRYQILVKEIKKILLCAIKHRGTTIQDHTDGHGKKGSFQNKLKIYGKFDENCCRCQTKLTHTKLGQRTTFFCLFCQNN